MPNLPQNTSYNADQVSKSIPGAFESAQKFNRSVALAKRKTASPQNFSNLSSTLRNISPGQQVPSRFLNVPSNGQRYNISQLGGAVTTKPGTSTRYESFHPGIDIARGMGSQIPSFTGGKVTEVVGGQRKGSKGYGNYVVITDEEGNKHRYSHLLNSWVRVGQQVTPGQMLGQEGNTGQTYSLRGGSGSHLDYRITDAYNRYINPYKYITS